MDVLKKLSTTALVLAATVVILGAFTRLTDAGLGCPDWPGCYGQFFVPESKAATEMIHRYFASTLGLLMLGLCFFSYRCPNITPSIRILTTCLVILVIAQGLLGMWTVTWKLHPSVVMGHLLGGLTTISLLWYLTLSLLIKKSYPSKNKTAFYFALIGLFIIFFQIALGGWTSANYAALACPDFPQCQQQWLPPLNFKQAFNFFHPIGPNYEFGILTNTPRVTIHMMHRFGALITTLYITTFGIWVFITTKNILIKRLCILLLILLAAQVTLGITNVLKLLPLSIAVTHNAVGVTLFLSMLTLVFFLKKSAEPDRQLK